MAHFSKVLAGVVLTLHLQLSNCSIYEHLHADAAQSVQIDAEGSLESIATSSSSKRRQRQHRSVQFKDAPIVRSSAHITEMLNPSSLTAEDEAYPTRKPLGTAADGSSEDTPLTPEQEEECYHDRMEAMWKGVHCPDFAPSMVTKPPTFEGGILPGTCNNVEVLGNSPVAYCPERQRIVGCSCYDKDRRPKPKGPFGCSSYVNGVGVAENPLAKAEKQDSCHATTQREEEVYAVARCCMVEWWTNYSIRLGAISAPGEGEGSWTSCEEGETLLGCSCLSLAGGNGCRHNMVRPKLEYMVEDKGHYWMMDDRAGAPQCVATNVKRNPAGVQAQALCAIPENTSRWETMWLKVHAVDQSTNISCSKKDMTMISCSCGSSTNGYYNGCDGGKVLDNKCECDGLKCMGSARCAWIGTPSYPCWWRAWGDWSDCSVSCGNGTMSRVREIGSIAHNGGQECIGNWSQTGNCTAPEDMACIPPVVKKEEVQYWLYIVAGATGLLTIVALYCVCCRRRRPSKDAPPGYEDYADEQYGEEGYGEGEG